MISIFKKKTKKERLQARFNKLLNEWYKLYHKDKKMSDIKYAEARLVAFEIKRLKTA
ncbi:Lacal_2735 family protein [Aestuariivivens sediminis]|uniref:Lacal_2735 family protein n=1 Tax=Aestuariivivens sediminis TaxID=2913557 RepID=UPI001F56E1DC|nr:Lacal_2735 family protein [Aestuariivivens sediminis]